MMTTEMENLKEICDKYYCKRFEFMAQVYKQIIEQRKERGDIKGIEILEKDLETIQDMDILTEKKV